MMSRASGPSCSWAPWRRYHSRRAPRRPSPLLLVLRRRRRTAIVDRELPSQGHAIARRGAVAVGSAPGALPGRWCAAAADEAARRGARGGRLHHRGSPRPPRRTRTRTCRVRATDARVASAGTHGAARRAGGLRPAGARAAVAAPMPPP